MLQPKINDFVCRTEHDTSDSLELLNASESAVALVTGELHRAEWSCWKQGYHKLHEGRAHIHCIHHPLSDPRRTAGIREMNLFAVFTSVRTAIGPGPELVGQRIKKDMSPLYLWCPRVWHNMDEKGAGGVDPFWAENIHKYMEIVTQLWDHRWFP